MSDLFSRVPCVNYQLILDQLDKMIQMIPDPAAKRRLKKQREMIRAAMQRQSESQERLDSAIEEVKKILPAVALFDAAHLGIEAGTAAGFALGRWEDE